MLYYSAFLLLDCEKSEVIDVSENEFLYAIRGLGNQMAVR